MAEEPKVEPTKVEPPKVEEPAAEPKIDVEGLMAELEKAGVTDTKALTGKLDAGAEAGHLAQLLGDARSGERAEQVKRQNAEAQVAELQKRLTAEPGVDPFEPTGQTMDLQSEIVKGVNAALNERDAAAQKVQQYNLAQWNRIQTDKDYHLVQEVWEKKQKDPNFVMKIQNRMVDPFEEYQETVRGYYKGIAQQSLETIKQLRGDVPPIPHVETGGRVPTNIVSEDHSTDMTETEKKRKELAVKVEKGHQLTEEEEMDVIDSLLTDSPIAGAPIVDTPPK